MAVKELGAVRPSARDRLLAAANELFYNEGVHTVGIDRIIEQAGVAKASLYNTFGSKDELVRAYLETRHESVTRRITEAVERYDSPRERLLAVFEGQGELFAQPDYKGCAFARASAESHPGDQAEQAAEAYRRWVRALLTELAGRPACPSRRSSPASCTCCMTAAGSPRGWTTTPARPPRPAPPRPSCLTPPWPAEWRPRSVADR